MWRIEKGPEPRCLAELRREIRRMEDEAGAPVKEPWKEVKGAAKEVLRDALVRVQHGLCAYCGGRLVLTQMKIEHFIPQIADPARILDWDNLLGACSGRYRVGAGRAVTHCDSHRTQRGLLHVHPAKTDPRLHFRVNVTSQRSDLGTIEPLTAEATPDLAELNLNASRLVENRAAVVRDLRARLQPLPPDKISEFLRRRLEVATKPGVDGLPAYAHVAAEYIRRKLRQRGQAP
ncbi:MAG: TIGR02646 family protein [Nannocystis sp.]|nr:TIGR02646 family protein [Nannocystis sp.]